MPATWIAISVSSRNATPQTAARAGWSRSRTEIATALNDERLRAIRSQPHGLDGDAEQREPRVLAELEVPRLAEGDGARRRDRRRDGVLHSTGEMPSRAAPTARAKTRM